jgi:hypothetical protein
MDGEGRREKEETAGRVLLEWIGELPRLHQARGGITLIDEDTPRSGIACADTTTMQDTAAAGRLKICCTQALEIKRLRS